MQHKTKAWLGLLAFAAVSAVHIASMGGQAALVRRIGLLSYPTMFGYGMFQAGLVFVVLSPAMDKRAAAFPAMVGLLAWLRKKMTVDHHAFKTGLWGFLYRRGVCVLATGATVFPSPIVGAGLLRAFGTPERVAWRTAFTANLIGVTFWNTIYLLDHWVNLVRTGHFQ